MYHAELGLTKPITQSLMMSESTCDWGSPAAGDMPELSCIVDSMPTHGTL